MPKRDRGLEREWRQRMRARDTGGLTVRTFCELEGLAESAFYFWRRELQRRDVERGDGRRHRTTRAVESSADRLAEPRRRPSSPAGPRFVPVVVTEGHSSDAAARVASVIPAPPPTIELVHPGGIVVRVPAGCDAAALRTVLGVLDDRRAEAREC